MPSVRLLLSSLGSALCLLLATPAAANDPDVEALERQMETLEAEMDRLRERLRAATGDAPERERAFGGLFRKDTDEDRGHEPFGGLFGRGDGELAGRDSRTDRQVHKLIENPEALREAAREMERALEEADIFESLADMMIALSEDITVVEDGDSMSLELDGESVATVETDGEERVTLRALGRKLTMEME